MNPPSAVASGEIEPSIESKYTFIPFCCVQLAYIQVKQDRKIKIIVSSFSTVNFPNVPEPPFFATPPPLSVVPHRMEDFEVIGDDLDSLLDNLPPDQGLTEVNVPPITLQTVKKKC